MATINVTTFNDENNGTGDVSLREAIILANSNAEADTINLLAGTYTLNIAGQGEDAAATGDLDILNDGGNTLTIIGAGQGSTTIDGGGIDRVFDLQAGANLTVSDLTVTGGQTPSSGDFIDQSGGGFRLNRRFQNPPSLSVSNSSISGNSANGDGGGIYSNYSRVNISNSSISDNSAAFGGGIFNIEGTVNISDSSISGNSANGGGGILNDFFGTVNISDSIISDNSASRSGGGIFNIDVTTVDISDSIISGNSAGNSGGGIFNINGTADISNSTISDNSAGVDGGGIFIDNDESTADINNSTISGNSAGRDGGGIFSNYDSAISNSTISGNSAGRDGGGIFNSYEGETDIRNSTITENIASTGSGVASDLGSFSSGTTVTSSIISGNTGGGADVELVESPDSRRTTDSFTSNGNNLVGIIGANVNAFSQPTDITGVTNPLLGPLQNNGGSTETHALLAASPAINAGSNPLGLTTDQRGSGFDREVGQVDIGAFELQSLPNLNIDIETFTNGVNADTLDNAATVAAGETVTWTYEVTNTGNTPFAEADINVTDDQGVNPVLDTSTDVGSDNVLSPGETWIYTASEAAQDLNEVIDFEQFSAGDQGNTINAGLSGVSISTDWREGIMIFDSANPTGDPDDDLGTPNVDFGGPGNRPGGGAGTPGENSIPQSQVLILSQDGDPTDPNDNREGGTITFDWDTPVRVNQIGILDIDTYEGGSTVTTFDASGNVIDTYDLLTLGDNSFQIVSMDDINVSRMEVFFSGSAAITEIDFDNAYQNISTVTVDGFSDSDPSSYFNPFVGPKDPAPQDGTTNPPTPSPDGSIRFEAENLNLDDYEVESKPFASNGELVALNDTQGSVSTTFNGTDGTYEFTLAAFDENDGESAVRLLINGEVVGEEILNQNLDGSRASANNLVELSFTVELEEGDTIAIQGTREDGERARLDYFELEKLDVQPSPTAPVNDSTIRFFEAEDLLLNNYTVESKDFASGDKLIALDGPQGSASTTFDGVAGNYTLSVNAFDENDGQSPLKVLVNGVEIGQAVLDQDLGGTRASADNLVSKTFDLTLQPGDTITIEGSREDGELARLDSALLAPASLNVISSTPQDELLSGGANTDLFSFTAPLGDDIVNNFTPGVDQLLINNIDGVDSFNDLNITTSGSNTIVSFPGLSDSITLEGVNSLTSDDVLFGN